MNKDLANLFFVVKRTRSFGFDFCLNIVLAAIISLILLYFQTTGWGRILINEVYDQLVRMDFQEQMHASHCPISEQIRLVPFDRESYQSSQSRGFWTPRDKLGRTIRRAVECGAKVVIADFGLKYRAPVPENGQDGNAIFLKELEAAAQKAQETGAVILLPWPGEFPRKTQKDRQYAEQLHKLMDSYERVLHWGSAKAFEDRHDFMVRHFRFFEETDAGVFISLPIMALVYLHHGPDRGDAILDEAKDDILQGKSTIEIPPYGHIQMKRQKDLTRDYITARYLFRIAPRERIQGLNIEDPLMKYDIRQRAGTLPENAPEFYQGKAVIIGSENPEIGDIHLTPIGRLPGMYLMANGLNLFLQDLQLHQPSIPFRAFIEAVVILLSTVVFIWLRPSLALLILATAFYFTFSAFSLDLFTRYGLFVDFWFPVIGVGVSWIVARLDNYIELVRDIFKKEKTPKEEPQS